MSYQVEKGTGDIVIQGFEQGIANDPYEGISDCRNINLISIPKEASVNFSTAQISAPNLTGTMTTSSSSASTVTMNSGALEGGQAIQFSILSDATKGIVTGVTYWVEYVSSGVYKLHTTLVQNGGDAVTITANNLTGTWATINMVRPRYFTFDTQYYWMVDASGYVWTNRKTTLVNAYWEYSGNQPNANSQGNGIVSYAGYVFVFSNTSIDYITLSSLVWTYGWNWLNGTLDNSGNWTNTPTQRLNYSGIYHPAIVAPDNKVYICDGSYIDRFFQQAGSTFTPTTAATYVADITKVLPLNDTAQCLAPLANNLMIGGMLNVVYPWDTFSQTALYPILLAEYNIVNLVTVNTNCFIFVGNRGRVWITNGSQAQLFVKIPDHLSGTVEPYYTWGGAFSNKNQVYFSALVTTNSGSANNNYGGVWAINLSSGLTGIDIGNCLRLVNQLSYGTYAGYASAMTSQFTGNPAGTGYFAGWYDGVSGYGIDTTSSAPYSSGQAYIDSDLIPAGTFLKPVSNGRVEFKLAVPIVSGESIKLQYRQKFSDSFTDLSSTVLFNYGTSINGGGNGWNGYIGGYQSVNFQNSQWIQIRTVLTSTASSPSYVRLTELRIGY